MKELEDAIHFQNEMYRKLSCVDAYNGYCSFCGQPTWVEYTGTRGNYSAMWDAVACDDCMYVSKKDKKFNYETGEKL